ncbi:MAG: ATP-binding cassette domain-containing protein [Methanoculleus bourgensis]|uniref:ATP-binding cassette domain-containing protein n=1 Tax=Methanoculleus bourgensis TaxID=83986 RepID=A0A7K4C3W6_9EURY|nr:MULTISPECIES: ATP-binding cassette domain-containing protein [Methanoculleus]MDD3372976.1 ATP-binding cassette domain-containing protein [Methanoculleus bourgensis]NMA88777.1 ATP-binding cassette domain-containing protein [Methanoculleus bourgensis]NQS77883.1 ATP-binding cassette domain-containing protein [Methanoculleus bourgensis]SAI88687.1 peptide/nickel transport system ATP-binding protein [Methanoculleus bourgensis]
MRVDLEDILFSRGQFSLRGSGTFGEGVHLVSGPVGSGKSTLALMLAELNRPESGAVRRHGISSALLLLQFPEYHITCSTVAEEAGSWGLDPDELLVRADLAGRGDDDPFHLSRGELKRLILACMIMRNPDLLMLDEPFSSLDCAAKRRACSMIEERSEGITIIFSHERAVLPRVDALWEMEGGTLKALGRVPGAIPRWRHAPPYLTYALEQGARPENIRLQDAREALCRTQG